MQIFGPQPPEFLREIAGRCQAAVTCLKSRSIPPGDACRQSLEALEGISILKPAQIYFKYCSTFDSTPRGNIGPVTDALMDRLGVDFAVAVPALPVNQRTQYLGHLFVGEQMLSDSHMRHHPLNPMTDSNLVRVLQAQTCRRVGLIPLPAVEAGSEAIRREMESLRRGGTGIALVDAVSDRHLAAIAEAVRDLRLITGGSGLGMALPAVWRAAGLVEPRSQALQAGTRERGTVVLSGSCSAATLRQLEELRKTGCAMIRVDGDVYSQVLDAVRRTGCAAACSSAPPGERDDDPARFEALFGALAVRLVEEGGVRNLVVAGGETSGAVVSALRLRAVEITGILDPGVPSVRTIGEPRLALALKSGNFGSDDFFDKAIRRLEAT